MIIKVFFRWNVVHLARDCEGVKEVRRVRIVHRGFLVLVAVEWLLEASHWTFEGVLTGDSMMRFIPWGQRKKRAKLRSGCEKRKMTLCQRQTRAVMQLKIDKNGSDFAFQFTFS